MSIVQGLCGFGSNLYAGWKGEIGDDRLFYSLFNGATWASAKTIPGNSSVGPGLAATSDGLIVAAWKGEHLDSRLFFASFAVATQTWSAQAQISNVSSSIGPSLTALGNTVYAAWVGVDNDQTLYFASLDESTGQWPSLPGISGAASAFGPSLAALGNTLYAAWVDPDGALFYASFNPSTKTWSTQTQISNVASSIGPSLAALGSTLYAAWKGEDNDQGIYYASFNPSTKTWSGQTKIPNVGSSVGAVLAALGDTLYAMWVGEGADQSLYYASFDATTSQWSPQATLPGNSGQDFVPPPTGGLGSNSNYLLYSNCNPILNLSVTITVTEDIVIKNGGGFSFQLNAYSPQNQICDWQQYLLTVNTNPLEVNWQVDNWPLAGGDNLINTLETLTPITSAKIPAGFQFSISLGNDAKGNVVSVDWAVGDNEGSQPTLTTETTDLTSLFLISPTTGHETTNPVTSADLAPIIAFQLDFVGPDESTVTLLSGAGTIAYTATTPLTPLSDLPNCAEWFGGTAETSNSYYGPLPPTQGGTITQSFGVNSSATPMISKAGPRRRFTPKAPKAG